MEEEKEVIRQEVKQGCWRGGGEGGGGSCDGGEEE